MSRRLVVDLASPRAAFRIPAARVSEIAKALGDGWDVKEVKAPAVSDGDGGSGSPEAVSAAQGAEIYFGWGVPSGVVAGDACGDGGGECGAVGGVYAAVREFGVFVRWVGVVGSGSG